ncbi:MAG: YbaY family lipoprotein [Hyphomonadaceae bacterium]|nr:YbaY family lipoprotein [Hyphomonadaceae bacterium]
MRVLAVLAAVTMAAGCGTTLPRGPGERGGMRERSVDMDRITGQVHYRALAALPRPGELKIILSEGEGGPIVSEERIDITDSSSPPFAFTLRYDKGMIERNREYALVAEVRDAGGDLRFASPSPVAVLTHDAPSRDVSLGLAPASAEPSPVASAPQEPASLAPRMPATRTAAAAPISAPIAAAGVAAGASATAAAGAPVGRARPTLILPAGPSAGAATPVAPAPRTPAAAPTRTAAATPATAASATTATTNELRFDRIDFRAVGPNWILDLYPNRMDLSFEDGGRRIEVARPVPVQPPYPGLIYQARLGDRALVVTIRREACRVAAAGETYPSRVTVEVEGKTLEGCGRAV